VGALVETEGRGNGGGWWGVGNEVIVLVGAPVQ
jgi:hypothetical protein